MIARHLQRVHGGALDDRALRREVQRAFDSYARYWMEAFRLSTYSPEYIDAHMSSEGMEHIDEALRLGNGAIVAITHLGQLGLRRRLAGAARHAVAGGGRRPPAARAVRVVRGRSPRRRASRSCASGPEAGTAVLRALKANHIALAHVRPRRRRRGRRGRAVRRAHDAARRARDPRAPHGGAAAPAPRCTSRATPATSRSCAHPCRSSGRVACATTSPA